MRSIDFVQARIPVAKALGQAPRCSPSHDLYLQAQVPVESAQSVRRRERGIPDLAQLQAEIAAAFDEADEDRAQALSW
jgi:hypothetical protein